MKRTTDEWLREVQKGGALLKGAATARMAGEILRLRAELERIGESTIAIEGDGVPWDRVMPEYHYTGELVAKKCSAGAAKVADLTRRLAEAEEARDEARTLAERRNEIAADERERRTETAADNVTLQLALAAAQADNARLREALEDEFPADERGYRAHTPKAISAALAQPLDTSALRALLRDVWRDGAEYGCADASTVANTPHDEPVPSEAYLSRVLHRSGEASEGGGA